MLPGERLKMPPTQNFAERKGLVIFERKGTVEGLFEAKSLLDPVTPRAAEALAKRPPARQPEFLVSRKFFHTSWWARLGTLFSRYPAHLKLVSNRLFRDVP